MKDFILISKVAGFIYEFLKILTGKKAPSNNTPALLKITNIGVWSVGTLNQLFTRDS